MTTPPPSPVEGLLADLYALMWTALVLVILSTALAFWIRHVGGAGAALRQLRGWLSGRPQRANVEQHYMEPAAFAADERQLGRVLGGSAHQVYVNTRLVLGKKDGRVIEAEQWLPVAIISGTGGGKSSSLIIPAVLEWSGSLLTTSVKLDVLRATLIARRARGPVACFDPARVLQEPENADLAGLAVLWTPLAACFDKDGRADWTSCMAMGESMVHATEKESNNTFWDDQSAQLLGLCLYLVAADKGAEATMREVVAMVLRANAEPGATRINALAKQAAPFGVQLLGESLQNMPENTRGGVVATAQTALSVYLTDDVADARVGDCFDPAFLLGEEGTLYLIGATDKQHLFRPLFTALTSHTLVSAMRHGSRQPNGELPIPLLMAIDEAANVAPVPRLDEYVTTSRGFHIQWLLAWQSMSQIEHRYGRLAAETIISNSPNLVIGPKILSPDTLDWIEKVFGNRVDEYQTTTVTEGRSDAQNSTSKSKSESTSTHRERLPLLEAGQVAVMPEETLALIVGGKRIIAEQRRYYEVPALLALSNGAQPQLQFAPTRSRAVVMPAPLMGWQSPATRLPAVPAPGGSSGWCMRHATNFPSHLMCPRCAEER